MSLNNEQETNETDMDLRYVFRRTALIVIVA